MLVSRTSRFSTARVGEHRLIAGPQKLASSRNRFLRTRSACWISIRLRSVFRLPLVSIDVEQPLLAGEFNGGMQVIGDLFERREHGFPLLSTRDESTEMPGLFLCGPLVRHDHHVFCFIYKYRHRFAVVAKAIANYLYLPAEELETYRKWGMYLDDLSCCGEECVC